MVSVKMGGMTMNCMKCGMETEAEQVFCQECLQEMEKYPVRPETVVFLPRRQETFAVKAPLGRRRTIPAEEQLQTLKRRIRILTGLWLVTLAALAAMAYPAMKELVKEDGFLPGQNYSSLVSQTTAPTEELPE